MVKRLRLQEARSQSRRRRRPPQDRWVFEPRDVAMVAILAAAVLWLQWILTLLTA